MKKQHKYVSIVVAIAVIGGVYFYLNRPQFEPQKDDSVAVSEEETLGNVESQKNSTQKVANNKLVYRDDTYGFTFEYPKIEQAIVETNNLDKDILRMVKVKINNDAGYINVKTYDRENYTSIGHNYPPVFMDEVKEFISSPEEYKDGPLKCWPDIKPVEGSNIPPAPPDSCHIDIIKTAVASLPTIQTSYSSTIGYACETIFVSNKYIFVVGQKVSPCLDGNPEYYQSLPENVQEEWANFRQLLASFRSNQ